MIPDPFKPYLYGALAIAGMLFIWAAVDTVQKAALYEDAQVEIAMGNETIESLVNEHVIMQEKNNAEAKKRHEIAIRAAKLERKYNAVAVSGDSALFNEQLCINLEGIQGSRFGEEADITGSACNEAARGKPAYTLSAESGEALLTNLSRINDYVNQVEELRE